MPSTLASSPDSEAHSAFAIVTPLESALARPQRGYYADPIEEAAALWESLSQNHPFIDGNKRVAVTVVAAFLSVNGYRLKLDDSEAFGFLIGLYESGTLGFAELEHWLRQQCSQD